MNILIFTKHDMSWGSSKERIGNYLEFLMRRGHQYKTIFLIPNTLSEIWIGNKKSSWIFQKSISFFYNQYLRYLKSMFLILVCKKYDVILIQKVNLPPLLLKILSSRNKNIVFDFDDLCFSSKNETKNFKERLKQWWNLYQNPNVLGYFKHIIAGNKNLAEIASNIIPSTHITILPTPIDCRIYIPPLQKKQPDHVTTIGWIGSGENHYENLKLLTGPLEKIALKHKIRFVLIGAMHSNKIKTLFHSSHYNFICIDWLKTHELVQKIQSFDIGLMPLMNDKNNQGKCGFKALAYMGCGIATIVSPIGINREIIQDGHNGFWANSEDEWVKKISRLIQNKNLRDQFSLLGRKTVEHSFSLEKKAPVFLNILENVCNPSVLG